jgi:WD40 repeat protein
VTTPPLAPPFSPSAISPDLEVIAIVGFGLSFYNLSTSHLEVKKSTEPTDYRDAAISWSPDRRFVAVMNDAGEGGRLDLYDGRTFAFVATLSGKLISTGVTWTPDGKFLVFANVVSEIRFWNVDNKQVEATLRPQEGLAFGLGVSPDKRKLFVVGLKEPPRIYSLDALPLTGIDDLMNLARRKVHGTLAPADCDALLHLKPCPAVP